MTVAVLIGTIAEAPQLLRWALRVASARQTELLILQTEEDKGNPRVSEISVDDDSEGQKPSPLLNIIRETINEPEAHAIRSNKTIEDTSQNPSLKLKILYGKPLAVLVAEIAASEIEILIVSHQEPIPDHEAQTALERQLFKHAPCEILLLRPGQHSGALCNDILVPCATGAHCQMALRLAQAMANTADRKVTALFVEPEVGIDARLVGQSILGGLVNKALGKDTERVNQKVVVANKIEKGIAAASDENYDLVLVGASKQSELHRMLFGSVPEALVRSIEGPAIAAVRAAMPIKNRVGRAIENFLQSTVPQLERENRVAMVERVQSNSEWKFDFILLICLSTFIAALGLTQNSTAVVIGAMLVAPLMTPLLGIGLALVQGNLSLLRSAVQSVLFGFLLALAVAYAVGLLFTAGLSDLTAEMKARSLGPGLPDLLVALASGIAAAYATSRPSLSAALPGVAIAAALVPPIATVGLASALWKFHDAGNALALFGTNIVAIVFGAAISLWAVGIRGSHMHSEFQRWTAFGMVVVFTATVGIAIKLSM